MNGLPGPSSGPTGPEILRHAPLTGAARLRMTMLMDGRERNDGGGRAGCPAPTVSAFVVPLRMAGCLSPTGGPIYEALVTVIVNWYVVE